MNKVERYLKNAKEILNEAEKGRDYYSDIKYVSTFYLYLRILKFIDGFFLRGVEKIPSREKSNKLIIDVCCSQSPPSRWEEKRGIRNGKERKF